MDTALQARFITPAFFFVGILVLGFLFDTPPSLASFKDLLPAPVVAVIGALLAGMFPLGFVITGVTTAVLRAVFWVSGRQNYQISLSDAAWRNVWHALRLDEDVTHTKSNKLFAAITFDHELLSEGVHASSVRLWTAFNIASNSATALILAILVNCLWLHIRWTQGWIAIIVFLEVLFVTVAVVTWREHMGLLEFQSHRLSRAGLMPHQERKNNGA